MTPDEGAGVSDFGISALGRPPVAHPAGSSGADAPSPRVALADALRRITTVSVGRDLSDGELARATEDLHLLAERLEAAAGGRRPA